MVLKKKHSLHAHLLSRASASEASQQSALCSYVPKPITLACRLLKSKGSFFVWASERLSILQCSQEPFFLRTFRGAFGHRRAATRTRPLRASPCSSRCLGEGRPTQSGGRQRSSACSGNNSVQVCDGGRRQHGLKRLDKLELMTLTKSTELPLI